MPGIAIFVVCLLFAAYSSIEASLPAESGSAHQAVKSGSAHQAVNASSVEMGGGKFIWKDCGSALAKIDDLEFKGCAHSSHMGCRIVRGTNVTASVTFTLLPTATPVKSAETKIHAVIAHVPIPWSPDNVDACKGCGLQCPLQAKTQYTYSLSLYVRKIYPSIRATIEWEVVDQDSGKDLFCFKAPIVVV